MTSKDVFAQLCCCGEEIYDAVLCPECVVPRALFRLPRGAFPLSRSV